MTPEATPEPWKGGIVTLRKADPRALIMRRGLDLFQAGLDEVTDLYMAEYIENHRLSRGAAVGNA